MKEDHNETCPEDCGLCESRIDEMEAQKNIDLCEPRPLKNDGLKRRGDPRSDYYQPY